MEVVVAFFAILLVSAVFVVFAAALAFGVVLLIEVAVKLWPALEAKIDAFIVRRFGG